jgi:hypothetical protein
MRADQRQWSNVERFPVIDSSIEKVKPAIDASLAGGFGFLGYHFEQGMKWPRKSDGGLRTQQNVWRRICNKDKRRQEKPCPLK